MIDIKNQPEGAGGTQQIIRYQNQSAIRISPLSEKGEMHWAAEGGKKRSIQFCDPSFLDFSGLIGTLDEVIAQTHQHFKQLSQLQSTFYLII